MAKDDAVEFVSRCGTCGGTGLFRGLIESSGEAVVCRDCSGSGGITRRYVPFTGRREVEGVRSVITARSDALFGGQTTGRRISYQEFLETFPETPSA